jgi:hypothetical protein
VSVGRKTVNGLVDAPEFSNGLGQPRWAVIDPQRPHDRGRLDHAELEGTGQAKQVVPVVFDEIRIDALLLHR